MYDVSQFTIFVTSKHMSSRDYNIFLLPDETQL